MGQTLSQEITRTINQVVEKLAKLIVLGVMMFVIVAITMIAVINVLATWAWSRGGLLAWTVVLLPVGSLLCLLYKKKLEEAQGFLLILFGSIIVKFLGFSVCIWLVVLYGLLVLMSPPRTAGVARVEGLNDWVRHVTEELPNLWTWRVPVEWPDNWEAANTLSVIFKLDESERQGVEVEIFSQEEQLTITSQWTSSGFEVIFPARRSGKYRFYLVRDGRRLPVWERHVLPGLPEPQNCRLIGLRTTSEVVTSDTSFAICLAIRDKFGNTVDCHQSDCDDVSVNLDEDQASVSIFYSPSSDREKQLGIRIKFLPEISGYFPVNVKYKDINVSSGNINFLVLLPEQNALIHKNIQKYRSNNYFEVTLTKLCGSELKPKHIYAYVTDKHLILKEFYFKLIPRRLVSYRVCPAVKLSIRSDNTLAIHQRDDGDNETVVMSDSVLLLVSTFYTILLKRIGGSNSFSEKKQFFYQSIVKHHDEAGHRHSRLPITVNRESILESTFRASRYFMEQDWARLFEVQFSGEIGIDQGGLRREFFEILTRYIFDPENKMFVHVEEGADAGSPVQPNPKPPANIKLKHYRLAGKIVGKCMYESATGAGYRQNLNAKLANSLLAQIIGVDVHYTMLEKDAPLLWRSKIKFILENPVEDLDLTFTQEEWDGNESETVELVPGGASKPVTDRNKLQYVKALAMYLLSSRVEKQVKAFLEGVHTLVPNSLFTLWDESELELVLCGVRKYDIEQLRQNHVIVGMTSFSKFQVVLEWFWQAVTHMTREDFSRLVQFCTGSSLLPPGGFADLEPKIQISWNGSPAGSLPMSHTCSNHLELPDAESYQQLEHVLLLAVREGSEGFLIA